PRREIADRQHADQAVEEPYDLPHPVALDDVHLPLGKAEQGVHLGVSYLDAHSPSSSPSSCRLLPDRSMNTSSSALACPSCAYRRHSSSGVPSASTRPASIMRTRSHSSAASSMSCVHRRTVTSRSPLSI